MATATCSPPRQPQALKSSMRRGTVSFSHNTPARQQRSSFSTLRNPIPQEPTTNTAYSSFSGTLRAAALYPRQLNHTNQQNGATAGPSSMMHLTTIPVSTTIAPIENAATNDEFDERPKKRARSEPPTTLLSSYDTNMIDLRAASPSISPNDRTSGDADRVNYSQSNWGSDQATFAPSSPECAYVESTLCPTVIEESEEQSQSQSQSQTRSVSPTPTEIDDPEPEYVESQLQSLSIKIRDFCYEPQPAHLTQIPELFDQYDAIAEFEYRLSQNPRVYPISGKTLRRLLDMGWIDQAEVDERCEEMDFAELRKLDSRPAWPYNLKWIKSENLRRPDEAHRKHLLDSRKYGFARLDKIRRNAEQVAGRRERDHQEAQEALEKIRRNKGKAVDRGGDDSQAPASQQQQQHQPKRQRGTNEWSPPPQSSQPLKQYPAPLSSYDPEIYPEAAEMFESSQRGAALARVDTPPLEEPEPQRPVDNRPNALKRPARGLKRTLSRTQTFTQLL